MAEEALVGGDAHARALDLATLGLAAELPGELADLGEGLRRHEALLTALETNDRHVVLEALCDHGGQRYLQFRTESAAFGS